MNEESEPTLGIANPRAYCVAKRQPPFQWHRFDADAPTWCKVGGGLMAVTDGTPRRYIAPELIFAIDLDADGKPRVASYGCATEQEGLAATKPYTYESVRTMVATGRIKRRQWISYEEMVIMVRRVLPMAWVPTLDEFLAEYGLNAAQL